MGTAAAVLSPCGAFAAGKENSKGVDFNPFLVSLAHAFSSILKATEQQRGIQLVDELPPCAECSIRAATPYHTTARAADTMDMIHIDITGPFLESLGARGTSS